MDKALEAAKEIEKIALENNLSVQELIAEYKKAHNSTDQSKSYEHSKNNLKDILTDKADIDNGEIYEIETGQTIREL